MSSSSHVTCHFSLPVQALRRPKPAAKMHKDHEGHIPDPTIIPMRHMPYTVITPIRYISTIGLLRSHTVRTWTPKRHFPLYLQVLGHGLTYFWGPGKDDGLVPGVRGRSSTTGAVTSDRELDFDTLKDIVGSAAAARCLGRPSKKSTLNIPMSAPM